MRRSKENARQDAEADIGTEGAKTTKLMINPVTGRFFHRAGTERFSSAWVHRIDADKGGILKKFNSMATLCSDDPPTAPANSGCGVDGNVRDMTGLTTFDGVADHGASGPLYDLARGVNYWGRYVIYDF